MIKTERFRIARGDEGSRVSLAKIVTKVREARLNLWVRSWAMRKIVEAGSPSGELERAQAIYEAVLREKIFVPDPIDAELIAGAACTLADCDGLSFDGGDCDDLVVAYFGALMAVGIRVYLCAQCVMPPQIVLDHISGAAWIRSEKKLYHADPATRLAFGQKRPSSRDLWIDPMSGMALCEGNDCDISKWKRAPVSSHGDFVGVGMGPVERTHVGLSEGAMEPAKKIEGLDKFVRDIQIELLQKQGGLEAKWRELADSYKLMVATKGLLSAKAPGANTLVGEASSNWTPLQESYIRQLQPTVGLASDYLTAGAAGQRPVDRVNGDAVVMVSVSEPQIIKTAAGGVVVVNPNGPGSLPGGVPMGFMGFEPITAIVVVGIAAAVVISILAICETVKAQTDRARKQDLMDQQKYLVEKGYTPDQVNAAMAQLADTAQRIASGEAESKKADPLAQLATVAKFTAISVGVVGTCVAGAYLIQTIASLRPSRQPAAA